MSQHTEAPRASAPLAAAPPATQDKLPPLTLAAAGLTALSGLVTVASFGLFFWDSGAATPIIQSTAPLLVFVGILAVVVGAIILVKNKRSGFSIDGSQWAAPAIVAGLMLMTAAVFLPLVHALSMLVDESR